VSQPSSKSAMLLLSAGVNHLGSLDPVARFLHTCYRIGDIDRSVAFYEKLGFEERRRMPIGDEAINVFMGLPGEGDVLELTYNHGIDSYDLGSGYNHIALLVDDLDATLEGLAAEGIEPERPPYRPGGRTEGHRICFVRDPDGYRVELIDAG
jgi:lactoylglutathione lyase